MEVAPTLDDAQALRQLTLADEHLMICVCGVESDADARVLQEAVQKIIRIKLQMGSNHQVGLARARGSQLVIEQEVQTCNRFYKGMAALNALYIALPILKQFTRNVDALVATVPGLLCSADHGDAVAFDSLLAHAARLFSAQQEMRNASSFRLLFIYRQVKQSPQLYISQNEVSLAFINDPACHLDIIYWHKEESLETAQHVFDQLCEYDNTNPLTNFYFLEVGESTERLHQALVLMLSHPAHRMSQNTAEQLLGSWFSPTKGIDSLRQQN